MTEALPWQAAAQGGLCLEGPLLSEGPCGVGGAVSSGTDLHQPGCRQTVRTSPSSCLGQARRVTSGPRLQP